MGLHIEMQYCNRMHSREKECAASALCRILGCIALLCLDMSCRIVDCYVWLCIVVDCIALLWIAVPRLAIRRLRDPFQPQAT